MKLYDINGYLFFYKYLTLSNGTRFRWVLNLCLYLTAWNKHNGLWFMLWLVQYQVMIDKESWGVFLFLLEG